MQKGYIIIVPGPDEVIYAGFSKETARTFIESFEKYLNDNKDSVEALHIIYNSENVVITHDMLCDLRDKLISETGCSRRITSGITIKFLMSTVMLSSWIPSRMSMRWRIWFNLFDMLSEKSNSFEPVYRMLSALQLILRSNAAVFDGWAGNSYETDYWLYCQRRRIYGIGS